MILIQLMPIYIFYGNWSSQSFRKEFSRKEFERRRKGGQSQGSTAYYEAQGYFIRKRQTITGFSKLYLIESQKHSSELSIVETLHYEFCVVYLSVLNEVKGAP